MFKQDTAFNKLNNIDDLKVGKDVVLAPFTNFKVGGKADIYIRPQTEAAFIAALKIIRSEGWPLTVLGRATNVLISDRGIRGIVCQLSPGMNKIRQDGETLTGSAGSSLQDLAAFAARNGLSGLEFSCGIPASIGGAVSMNAGAYDGCMEDVLLSSRYIDAEGQVKELSAQEHLLGYRQSFFHDQANKSYIINSTFRLEAKPRQQIYDKMAELALKRYRSQPLEYPSAGSAFKRPQGHYAGKLIQDAGLKGFRLGHAAVSSRHAGFIVQDGQATASDIAAVFRHVQKTVYEQSRVLLLPEVKFIGDWDEDLLPQLDLNN